MKNSGLCDIVSLENRFLSSRILSVGFLYPDADWKTRCQGLLNETHGLQDLKTAFAASSLETLQAEHFRLFGSSGACPMELSFYLSENPFEQAKIMAELSGFHKAFGVESQDRLRPDHLSVCLEFLGWLLLKIANAMKKDLAEEKRTTNEALKSYVRDYLRPALQSFSGRLQRESQNAFYRNLTRILKEVEECDCL